MLSVLVLAGLGIVTSVIVARIYGIQVIGQFALAYAPTGAVWFLSTVREQPAMIRVLAGVDPRSPRVTGIFFAVLSFSAGLTLVVASIAAVVTWLAFNGPIDHPELFAPAAVQLAGFVLVVNAGTNLDSVYAAFRAGRQLFWIRIHEAGLYLVFAVIAGILWGTVWGLTLSLIAASLSALVHRAIRVRRWMRLSISRAKLRESFSELPPIVRFGLKITPGQIADGISNESGVWVLGVLVSTASVGAYSRAWSLGSRLAALNGRVTEMALPTLVERRAAGDGAGFDRALVESLRYVALAMLLPAAAVGGASTAVMELFGPGFSAAATALALMMLLPAVRTGNAVQAMALLAVDRPWVATGIAVGRMFVTVVATVVLANAIGITGAALAILIGSACDTVAKLIAMRTYMVRPLRHYWPGRDMAAILASYGVGFAAAHLVDLAINGPVALVAAIPAGALAYGLTFIGLGGLTPLDRGRIGAVLRGARAAISRKAAASAPPSV